MIQKSNGVMLTILTQWRSSKPQEVFDRFQNLSPSAIEISSITIAELEDGAYKSQRREQNQAALNQFLIPLEIVPFDERATRAYGKLRVKLEKKGAVIGSLDMLIAAQALALGLCPSTAFLVAALS